MNEQEHAAYWRGYNDAKEAIQSGQLRVWVGLTVEEIKNTYFTTRADFVDYAKAIEAKLKEKNSA